MAPKQALALFMFGFAGLVGCSGSTGSRTIVRNHGGAGGVSSTGGSGGTAGGPSISFDSGAAGGVCSGSSCDAGTDATTGFCGDGVIGIGETCDDGNPTAGDGCSGLCQLEPNFTCPTPGKPCVSTVVCGDGKVSGSEGCDDGNANAGDGCSDVCQVEQGWACSTPGQPCTKVVVGACGDSAVNAGEQCDDGNVLSNDGCSGTCQLEAGYTCPTPGQPCVLNEYCGDGILNGTEQCDDGNTVPGDGCTGLCNLEPNFVCPTPGQPCVSTVICGDSKVTGNEACDDGNTVANDGCAADCKSTEPGYICPKAADGTGGPCIKATQPVCGDGIKSAVEFCDDGNTVSGDGCSSTCTVEPGYECTTPGTPCTLIEFCGDGKLNLSLGEQCDDGNKTGGDGCSSQCKIEADYVCPQPGSPCIYTVRCGDRIVSGNETCDDGNLTSNDGCSATCQVEPGWTCPVGGVCRAAKCGDGIVAGSEQCDDGNATSGDGCSSTCQIELPKPTEKDAWMCPTPGKPCVRTTCGNGTQEGTEQCDDGNDDMGDGCTPFCRKEPSCPASGGACTSVCGDGVLLPIDKTNGQECDDGNNISGDGCSATCKVEAGYVCSDVPIVQGTSLILPVVFRDFKAYNETYGHPDFEAYTGNGEAGITLQYLSTTRGGKPVHVAADKQTTTNNNPGVTTDYFGMWYVDVPTTVTTSPANITILKTLTLTQQTTGVYQFASGAGFFPLDGLGWGNYGTTGHNFHFTSEVRYWFQYAGSEKLDFTGDDDLWVFINKQLAVDLGGVHPADNGNTTLDVSNGTAHTCDYATICGRGKNGHTVNLGLKLGSVYEIAVFQAERHTVQSNYTLTLSGFSAVKSSCKSVCGDGIVTPGEACDLGTAKNTGAYGTCNSNCTMASYCGDGVVNGPEQCDDGVNLTTYGGTSKKCGPGCKWSGFCGDGIVDSAHGEQCDDGANNGKGYGYCTSTCQLGPRCGDDVVNGPEQCDDGVLNGTSQSLCYATCTLKCGNGILDYGEQCDNGAVNNTGGYGKCNPDCTFGPKCGDGVVDTAYEKCDDGKNDGSYGTCAPGCVLGPRCGDGTVQTTAGEKCDKGSANVASGYGPGLCTTRCWPAPYCGDKSVDIANGETCDDGVNSGQPGHCTSDCKGYVPLGTCGNGVVDTGEQCDLGTNNGKAGFTCDGQCRNKCGNGFVDAGEQCDNGVNDGSYGTCNPNCTLAPYCGDGIKNGPEQCDQGANNQVNPYGPNLCTKTCLTAPYCGDGRIQSVFKEQCDSMPGCNNTTCLWSIQ